MNKEELIFQLEKETPILNTRILRGYIMKHYKVSQELASKIAVKITNYQIGKYGEIVNKKVAYLQPKKKASSNARQRRYERFKTS